MEYWVMYDTLPTCSFPSYCFPFNQSKYLGFYCVVSWYTKFKHFIACLSIGRNTQRAQCDHQSLPIPTSGDLTHVRKSWNLSSPAVFGFSLPSDYLSTFFIYLFYPPSSLSFLNPVIDVVVVNTFILPIFTFPSSPNKYLYRFTLSAGILYEQFHGHIDRVGGYHPIKIRFLIYNIIYHIQDEGRSSRSRGCYCRWC